MVGLLFIRFRWVFRVVRRSLLLRWLARVLRSRRALQIANSRLNLVDQAHVLVITHNASLGCVIGSRNALGAEIQASQIAHMEAGDAQQHGDRKEGHAERHGKAWRGYRSKDRSQSRLQLLEPA